MKLLTHYFYLDRKVILMEIVTFSKILLLILNYKNKNNASTRN